MLRFSDLERAIPAISQKMLIQQLRQMEADGVVHRTVYQQVPPKVEYRLTKWGQALCPALDGLLKWAELRERMSEKLSWLPDTVARDKLGYILTGIDALQSGRWPLSDREPCPLETTVPGILAAGDIRAGSTKRVGFAVGDGSLAVTCVHRLIAIRQ